MTIPGKSSDEGSDAQRSVKVEEIPYEDCMLALVFLRCLRRDLVFQLSADNPFADLVLVWRPKSHSKTHTLLVHIEHERLNTSIGRWSLLPEKPSRRFGLRKLCFFYEKFGELQHMDEIGELLLMRKIGELKRMEEIGELQRVEEISKLQAMEKISELQAMEKISELQGMEKISELQGMEKISELQGTDRLKYVLLTNASLHESCHDMFERVEVSSVPGMELLNCGDLYRLKPDNRDVLKVVRGNWSFMDNFYLLCRHSRDIVGDVHTELKRLLDADDVSSLAGRLFNSIRQWKDEANVYLTRAWSKWQELVDDYIREYVSGCRAVTTRLRYRNVADVRAYLESRNPAWLRPPERGSQALSATKVHQVLADRRHIMVPARWLSDQQHQFSERRRRILHSWGSLCLWLVIVDDDEEGNSDILSNMVTRANSEHRLIIVSSRENNGFIDSCQSSDVSDDTWKECLHVRVTQNGDCHLRDLVAGVDPVKSLKTLLDDEPAHLLALALKMDRQLEPRPNQLVDLQRVPIDKLLSLGFRDVCITDTVQYESLRPIISDNTVTSFAEVESWIFTPYRFVWPLYVVTDNLDTIPEKIRKLPIFKFHIISFLVGDTGRHLFRESHAAVIHLT